MAKWLVQDSCVSIHSLENISNNLDQLNYDYTGFGLIPFTRIITGAENFDFNERCVVRGSTKILKNIFLTEDSRLTDLENYIKSGLFYDLEKFDQQYYSKLNLPLFNNAAKYYKYGDVKEMVFKHSVFVKPSRDLKFFAGKLFRSGESFNLDYIDNDLSDNEDILVSPLRSDNYHEYRCFVVMGELVSISKYFTEGYLSKSNDVEDQVRLAAKEIIKLYQPHDIFTVDIVLTDNGYEIMEYNCWNVSGFYTTDLESCLSAVNNYVDSII